jgi:F-type H+-transporting ATPase subunit alpha
MPLEQQVIVLFAGTQGYADKIPLEDMRRWEASLIRFMESSYPEIGKEIAEKKVITDETREKLVAALENFTASWQ